MPTTAKATRATAKLIRSPQTIKQNAQKSLINSITEKEFQDQIIELPANTRLSGVPRR